MSFFSSISGLFSTPRPIRSGTVEITPRIVDFGTRVIQLPQITWSRVSHVYRWRPLAVIMLLVAACCWFAAYQLGSYTASIQPFTQPSDLTHLRLYNAALIVTRTLLAVIALALWFIRKEFLLISTADGTVLEIGGKRPFLLEILQRIREPMSFEADRDVKFSINLDPTP